MGTDGTFTDFPGRENLNVSASPYPPFEKRKGWATRPYSSCLPTVTPNLLIVAVLWLGSGDAQTLTFGET